MNQSAVPDTAVNDQILNSRWETSPGECLPKISPTLLEKFPQVMEKKHALSSTLKKQAYCILTNQWIHK